MTYKVYKENGTKCVKKFDDLQDAHEWCMVVESNAKFYRIEWQYENETEPRRMYV